MVLEEHIHNKIRATFKNDPDYHHFTGKDDLQKIGREDIEAFQLFMLNKIIKYASEKSVFYKNLISSVGEVKTLRDITKIPFTDPNDLAQSPYKLMCLSMSQIARIFCHTTTGTTTGRLKKVFFTQYDTDRISDTMAVIMGTVFDSAGLDLQNRVVQIFLPNNGPPHSMAGLIAKGAERFGGIPVLGDCTATTREQIKAIEKARPDMLMGSAFRIWRITQEASFLCDLSKIGVRTIFITSEYLSAPMRKRLKEQWHAEVFHHYGMTEPGFVIGVECQAHNGFHFNETELFFEAVDPESGKVLESEEEGELVLSTLDREGMPLIRYRTGDVASIIRSPCQCGATTLVRIGSIPKRIALVTTIGDHEKIYTSLLDEVMYDFPGLVDYRVIISSKNGKDAFTCQVELLKKNEKTTEQVTRLLLAVPPIKKSIEAGLLLWPEIEIVDRGVLRRGGRTLKRRIKDTR